MSTFISIFGIIMTSITTIAVAIIGLHQAKVEKKNEEYRKLKEEHEATIQKMEEERQKSYDERLDKIETEVNEMRKGFDELRDEFDLLKLSNQLTQLHTLNTLNFEYVQSLSGVVSIIGEVLITSSIMDDNTKKRMQKEVDAHKRDREKISNDLIKIVI